MANAAERLVINTGPLIALAKIGALEVAGQLPLVFLCPTEVREELDRGEAKGFPAVDPVWLEVRQLAKPPDLVARVTLDKGEAAVIQLALELGIPQVCIDEVRGRRAAKAVGLEVVGTLGLLLRAKSSGIIPALRLYTDRLQRVEPWYGETLISKVLAAAGELGDVA
ncbi:MAG: DUF3368 domain-containing protein [Thermoanaerobaculia bacterium]|nr:DUF3368 domain-containing protein [Thermoanaerobaculia bacterium]